ncbi:MaoC family dehydratase N-terminal domain-containing protein [Rhodoferax sp.]|uniref:MaoC family dehydratase N-terminal domain-containing protein n=1 Tax=Rhodoferax sp. TaxID=50421 RepID=UPI00261BA3EA|nr:MaoC family dehydratase N-terminal domain-containing protein [Rhodoferax sp.]MDD3937862.1 MaoC family dehydratase N-terminal domain-containing protein [Rhodoferax sp.]
MWDTRLKGAELTPFSVEVERGRLLAFAKATGQDNPVYFDEMAARAAGHPSLPVPPTFFFCLEMDGPNPMEIYERLGIDYAHVLHGEQHFVFHRMAFAGEVLCFKPRLADLYEKKGGALGFLVWETRVEDSAGAAVADLRTVMVVRQPKQRGLA